MTVGIADLHRAINTAWDAHGINHAFKQYWAEDKRSEYPALHEQEASPNQPMPFCIFNQGMVAVVSRSTSSGIETKREIREVPWDFKIYAKTISTISAKTIASNLADVLLQKFGGHPTVKPIGIELENGNFLQFQYQNEFSMREGDDEYSWTVSYRILLDQPVRV